MYTVATKRGVYEIFWNCSIILSMGCFEPAKVVVGVEEGTLTEEELQALADDCENGNEEACEQLDALEEEEVERLNLLNPNEEDPVSDPSDWESWEDIDTSDPEDLVEWFEETIEECEDGKLGGL